MSSKSNDNGRAFEYAFINKLCKSISKYRSVNIRKDKHYNATANAWKVMNLSIKKSLVCAASAVIKELFNREPNLISNNSNIELYIQPDSNGQLGDVRDIVAKDTSIKWEIGFSLKHNHFAVKHSRLSHKLDFGYEWYQVACDRSYWTAVDPIFNNLKKMKSSKTIWSLVPNKVDNVYKPLLFAFMEEIKRAVNVNGNVPKRMVEYLLGKYDFWKMIGIDKQRKTDLVAFNMHNTLGKNSKVLVPIINLPTCIVGIKIDPKHPDNTVLLAFDEGWSFSFRIHSASTIVEPSLKFDIQIEGMPTSLIPIVCNW